MKAIPVLALLGLMLAGSTPSTVGLLADSKRTSTISMNVTATSIKYSGKIGSEPPFEGQLDDWKISANALQTLSFADGLQKNGEGKEELRRIIEEAVCEQTANVGDVKNSPLISTSPFKGEEFIFLHSEDGTFTRVDPEEKIDQSKDRSLVEYARPLRQLFPLEELKKDQEWRLPEDQVRNLLCPGGNLFPPSKASLRRSQENSASRLNWLYAPTELKPPAMLSTARGKVIVTYEGLKELESGEAHVARIAVDVTCDVDCSTYLEYSVAMQLPADRTYDYTQTFSLSLKGSGTLLLSTAVTGPSSLQLDLELEGTETFNVETELNYSTGEKVPAVVHAETGWVGECHVTLEDLVPDAGGESQD